MRVRRLHEKTWFGWSREALRWDGMKEYLRLALRASSQRGALRSSRSDMGVDAANTLGVCAEWWCFEITAMLSGCVATHWSVCTAMLTAGSWLGVEELGVQTILLNTFALAYMIPLGISVAGPCGQFAVPRSDRSLCTQRAPVSATCWAPTARAAPAPPPRSCSLPPSVCVDVPQLGLRA
jgi:hypothetical protein